MCIIEQKTYLQADGSPRSFERIRRCENAVGSGTCSNTRRTVDTARLVETRPDFTVPPRTDEVVTDSNGHTRVYRNLSRRSSQKHQPGHSRRSDNQTQSDTQRTGPSATFGSRRDPPISRPDTPNSAPPGMASFPPTIPSEPSVRLRPNGTAVYDLPPSLSMPRASVNERPPTNPPKPKVSFETDRPSEIPNRRRPSLSVHTGPRRSADASPLRSSPGLSRLPSIRRHTRTDSARENTTPDIEDKEYATRSLARETARRQQAEEEALHRRQEDLEKLANLQLDEEAERARNRRSFDPLNRLPVPGSLYSHRSSLDSERSSWSRHTSPPAPPRLPRPTYSGGRYASASPRPAHASPRRGRATVHHYHYPDRENPLLTSATTTTYANTNTNTNTSTRRPSDSIRDRGREILERERLRAAEELNAASAVEDGAGRRWEPVFDEVEERISGHEYYYVSEGPARQEIRRRRESWRGKRRGEFHD